MRKILLFLTMLLIVSIEPIKADNHSTMTNLETSEDSVRLAELDRYWEILSQTVKEGDFEGYKAIYHEDAIAVFGVGKNKVSVPIEKALAAWEKGFNDTKAGKRNDNVEFRFSQRIGSPTTAHETGIFIATSTDNNGVTERYVIHFEMLLIKKDDNWYALMEYQKSEASQEEWDALK